MLSFVVAGDELHRARAGGPFNARSLGESVGSEGARGRAQKVGGVLTHSTRVVTLPGLL